MTELRRAIPLRALFPNAPLPPWLAHLTLFGVRTSRDPREHPALLAQAAATPEEAQKVIRWRSDRRRAHWLAGRLAALEASRAQGWTFEGIVPHPVTGAPRLRLRGHLGTLRGSQSTAGDIFHPLSITHSGPWAVAALLPEHAVMGLDYEVGVRDKLYLKKQICSREEILHHRLEDDALSLKTRCERLARIWVLKEALLKAYGVGLVAGLKDFMAQSLELDAPLRLVASQPLHDSIPHPLPDTLWAAIGEFDGHPLALVAAPERLTL